LSISFVNPTETRRYDLSGGDWIEVRDRITYGAKQRLQSSSLKSMSDSAGGGTKIDIDFGVYKIERMAAYIVGWSARKPDGSPVKPDRDAFAALSEEAADEIDAALDVHIEARKAAAEAAEGNPTVPPIEMPSLSAAGSAGPTASY
jgi:hypothetical protein